MRLCSTLDLAVGSLFEPAAAGEVVRAGHHPPITFGGHVMREFLLTPGGERRLAALVSEIEPERAHTFRAAGGEAVRVLWVLSPALSEPPRPTTPPPAP